MLDDIKKVFIAKYFVQGSAKFSSIPLALNDEFGGVLLQKMQYYNTNLTQLEDMGLETDVSSPTNNSKFANDPKLQQVREQVDEIKNVVIENIGKLSNC